jgi:hypothetical protein
MSSRPVYILGTSGRVENPEKYSIEDLLKVVGLNTGNLMFQHAVTQMIADPKIFIGLTGLPYIDAGECKDGSYLVFPAANHLRTGADWSGLCGFFERSKIPLIVMGLGVQAADTSDPKATAEALKADASAMRLVAVLREKAAWISVRGNFTADVCQLLGLDKVDVLGCPSLMLNPHANAGQRIAAKLEAAKNKDAPRMALTAAGPWDIKSLAKQEIERKLLALLLQHQGLYVQQSGGEAALAFAMLKFDKLPLSALLSFRQILDPSLSLDDMVSFARSKARIFFDAGKWISAMESVDVCIGTRLHGNMAAMAAGTPGCVISHDSRTDELAIEMSLPRLGAGAVQDVTDTHDLLEAIAFNAGRFDEARAAKRANYTRQLTTLGLATPLLAA